MTERVADACELGLVYHCPPTAFFDMTELGLSLVKAQTAILLAKQQRTE